MYTLNWFSICFVSAATRFMRGDRRSFDASTLFLKVIRDAPILVEEPRARSACSFCSYRAYFCSQYLYVMCAVGRVLCAHIIVSGGYFD